MNKNIFKELIAHSAFKELFIEEMGWNNPQGSIRLPNITIDDTSYTFEQIAVRSGFQVLSCQVDSIPTSAVSKKIDTQLRKQANDYICIYHIPQTEHHLWVVPVKKVEKRDLVLIEYDSAAKAEFLYSKMTDLTFAYDEVTTIMDVKEKVQAGFIVNSEKITKDFYTGFRKEHTNFAKYITGLDDEITDLKKNRNKQWYTSVMLNRLMFCYFIQKKGFLDRNVNYLRDKLAWVKNEKGEDRFFGTFYRGFLLSLFYDGLNSPRHQQDFVQKYGRIPYLNGGMFSIHELEEQYPKLDIADEAFESLFAFFDQWHWHLDDRLTASGKDINPDVLGYIFEQYINDRAQMGAYYTKEDITEYIGRNTIIPFLMDATALNSQPSTLNSIWQFLQQSGDRYIFDAVKKGAGLPIPEHIAIGIDTTKPNLMERRSHWNEKTPEPFALPTEIWRETIERLQRYATIKAKIEHGEITEINDFITYNLDIRQFVQDLLAQTDDHLLVKHFYAQLRKVTILDPTCGSGAFLFAALNILEPLYEVCIDRMQAWNHDNPNLFKEELAELNGKYRSNIRYFIYKNIILRNLYGVDIMVEATEIAKLRLFLKMVAVVDVNLREDNLGLDPLPDIDFNIRCGNTLVGYATAKDLENDLNYGDMFAKEEFLSKVHTEMDIVAHAYDTFKKVQLEQNADLDTYRNAKKQLKQRLKNLDDLLNKKLFASTVSGGQVKYDDWLKSHQPFHWLAEYYDIINGNGGFDVVIGNPPYVEYNKKVQGIAVSDIYKLHGYKTIDCGNLYAYVLERSKEIMRDYGYISMIVPLSGHSTERMSPLVTHFYNTFGYHIHLNLSADANPQRLFEGVKFRLTIFFASNNGNGRYSSKYTRWLAEERKNLFTALVRYNDIEDYSYQNIIPKIANPLFITIAEKVNNDKQFFLNIGKDYCLYNDAPVNWMRSHTFIPYFHSERDGEIVSRHLKRMCFEDKELKECGCAVFNSTLFFLWWISHSSCYNVNSPEIYSFRLSVDENVKHSLSSINAKLTKDVLAKSKRRVYIYKTTGRVEYDEFYMKLSKPIIDEIDKVLAKHYGFTDEELDFIINYDIKYRMGDELESQE